jgi:hypothetical protein
MWEYRINQKNGVPTEAGVGHIKQQRARYRGGVAGASERQAAAALTSNPDNNHHRPISPLVKSIANQYRYSGGPVTPGDAREIRFWEL